MYKNIIINIILFNKRRTFPYNYKFKNGGGYGTFGRHLMNNHPTQIGVEQRQTQIYGYTTSFFSSHLFKYSDEQNKLELVRIISMEYLSFSFGEKLVC